MYGGHDDRFHRLLDRLRGEYEELVRRGLTGQMVPLEGRVRGTSSVQAETEACGSGRGLELEAEEAGFGVEGEEDWANDEAIARALAEDE